MRNLQSEFAVLPVPNINIFLWPSNPNTWYARRHCQVEISDYLNIYHGGSSEIFAV